MKKISSMTLISLLIISLFVFIVPLSAGDPVYDVWVDDDYGPSTDGWGSTCFDTIQEGIYNVAENGGTVHVAAGTYYENISFNNKNISIEGAGASTTIICGDTVGAGATPGQDGIGDGIVLDVLNCDGSVSISDFTITLGSTINDGGGFYIDTCHDMKIKNCIFDNNVASSGGGIYFKESHIDFENCIFRDNKASYKAGAMCSDNSSYTLKKCIFSNNNIGTTSGSSLEGTVISTDFSSSPVSETSGGGICNYFSDSAAIADITISNSIFINNSAGQGAGIYNYYVDSGLEIYNCTFFGNTASDIGGAIYNYESSPIISNCILWGDAADDGNDAVVSEIYNNNSVGVDDPIVTYSDVLMGSVGEIYPGTGNINIDPSFVDTGNEDFHLKSDSGCIDAGITIDEVGYDIDGDKRPQGSAYDMGADEYKEFSADLTITKTVSVPWAYVGTYVQFTVTVINNGPADATGVTVAEVLPDGLFYIYSMPSQGTYNGVLWDVGGIANGGQETLKIVVRANARGWIENIAVVSGNEPDSDHTNNGAEADVYVMNRRPISFLSTVIINQRNADLMLGNVLENLPEMLSPEVQELLDGVQDHIANASSLSNPIYSCGELVRAIALMEQINEKNGF